VIGSRCLPMKLMRWLRLGWVLLHKVSSGFCRGVAQWPCECSMDSVALSDLHLVLHRRCLLEDRCGGGSSRHSNLALTPFASGTD
jgi:hypothetical protein